MSERPFTIRPYRESDRERLKEITVIGFEEVSIDRNIERELGEFGGKDWRWRKARHIDADVDAQPESVFVAESDGEPVGYITSRIDRDTKIGWIPNMAVIPEMQGVGVGRALMNHCLDYMRSAGMECAKIETLAQNPVGQRFYPSVGFREVARQVHYAMRLIDEPSE